MTEEQAKTKNCPFAAISATMNHGGESCFKCDASSCALWVWDETPETTYQRNEDAGRERFAEDGHCGLVRI